MCHPKPPSYLVRTPAPWAYSRLPGLLLITMLGLAAAACSKKGEECKALQAAIAPLPPKLAIEVDDDKHPEKKFKELEALLTTTADILSAIESQRHTDREVQTKAAAYASALENLVKQANALRGFFGRNAAASQQLEELAKAVGAKKAAMKDLTVETSAREKRALADAWLGLGSTPKDIAESARALENMDFATVQAKAAARALAGRLREEATTTERTAQVPAKWEALVAESEPRRKAFALARASVEKADQAVTTMCTRND